MRGIPFSRSFPSRTSVATSRRPSPCAATSSRLTRRPDDTWRLAAISPLGPQAALFPGAVPRARPALALARGRVAGEVPLPRGRLHRSVRTAGRSRVRRGQRERTPRITGGSSVGPLPRASRAASRRAAPGPGSWSGPQRPAVALASSSVSSGKAPSRLPSFVPSGPRTSGRCAYDGTGRSSARCSDDLPRRGEQQIRAAHDLIDATAPRRPRRLRADTRYGPSARWTAKSPTLFSRS